MTTLKEFMKETLTQIVEAAAEFSADNTEKGVTTNPQLYDPAGAGFATIKHREGVATIIDFDVAISTEESEKVGAGGGIRVLSVIRAEGEVQTNAISGTASRVRFKIPLQLPGGVERRQDTIQTAGVRRSSRTDGY